MFKKGNSAEPASVDYYLTSLSSYMSQKCGLCIRDRYCVYTSINFSLGFPLLLDDTYSTRSWKTHDVTEFKQAFKFQAWSIIVETHKKPCFDYNSAEEVIWKTPTGYILENDLGAVYMGWNALIELKC